MSVHNDAPALNGSPRGRGTILLAEDEPKLRRLALRTLRAHGHDVLEAADGLQAVQVGQGHRGPIDLLVTDRDIPRLRGPQVAEVLRHVHPEMRVLYMSARAEVAPPHPREAQALPKPFPMTELARKVREMLSRPE